MALKNNNQRLRTAEEEDMFFPSEMQPFEVLQTLGTNSKRGLDQKEHKKRQKLFGTNILRRELHLSLKQSAAEQFKNIIAFIFMLSSAMIYVFDPQPVYIAVPLIMFAVLVFSSVLQYRASGALGLPRKYSAIKATVTRGDKTYSTDSRTLVPGDIIWLENNMVVPADCRLLTDRNLSVLETHLTNVTDPVPKDSEAISSRDATVFHPNMVYAGSIVTSGSCSAVVCFTGEETMVRKLSGKTREATSPRIVRYVREANKVIASVALSMSFLLLLAGIFLGADVSSVLLCSAGVAATALGETAVALAEAAFGFGLKNMAKHGAVIKNFNCISELCEINTVMCGKDTVTPPEKMSVDELFIDNTFYPATTVYRGRSLDLLMYSLLCSDLMFDEDRDDVFHGSNPDEAIAYAIYGGKVDLRKIAENYYRMDVKRDATGKPTRVLQLIDGKSLMIERGEPQKLLEECEGYSYKGQLFALSQFSRRKIGRAIREKGKDSSYIIGIAISYSKAQSLDDPAASKKKFFLGFVTFKSYIGVDNASAVYRCKRAGIETAVVSDEPYLSALSRGRDMGIISDESEICTPDIMHGDDVGLFIANCPDYRLFLGLTDEEWYQILLYRKQDGRKVAVCAENLDRLQMMRDADVSFVSEDSPDVLRQSADAILLGGGFKVISDMLHGAKRIYAGIHGMIEFIISTFSLMFTLCAVGLLLPNSPVRVQEVLICGVVINIAFALPIALMTENRNLFLEKLPDYGVLPKIKDFLMPVLYGIVMAGAVVLTHLVTGSYYCVMLASAVSMFLYALNGAQRGGIFRKKALRNGRLFRAGVGVLALMALLVLLPSAANVFVYTFPGIKSAVIALGIPVAAFAIFMFVCLMLDIRRKNIYN